MTDFAWPEYTGAVAPGCRAPDVDPVRVYAALVRDAGGDVGRPARPCAPCRWMLGRMRADRRDAGADAREDLARSLRSAHCVVAGVL